jgi:hypothetical protein
LRYRWRRRFGLRCLGKPRLLCHGAASAEENQQTDRLKMAPHWSLLEWANHSRDCAIIALGDYLSELAAPISRRDSRIEVQSLFQSLKK